MPVSTSSEFQPLDGVDPMRERRAAMPGPLDDADFSLVVGGPLYQLFLRNKLAQAPLDLLHRRVVTGT
jgi:hypothetical protein